MMKKLLEFGVSAGYLDSTSFVFIPEVMVLAPQICPMVHKKITEFGPSPLASCGFCAYAAIGATYLWHNDFNSFRKENIVECLSKPRGFDYMDEYVADLIGFNHGDIEAHLQATSVYLLGNMEDAAQRFELCLETMYKYGMVLAMNKMGLK